MASIGEELTVVSSRAEGRLSGRNRMAAARRRLAGMAAMVLSLSGVAVGFQTVVAPAPAFAGTVTTSLTQSGVDANTWTWIVNVQCSGLGSNCGYTTVTLPIPAIASVDNLGALPPGWTVGYSGSNLVLTNPAFSDGSTMQFSFTLTAGPGTHCTTATTQSSGAGSSSSAQQCFTSTQATTTGATTSATTSTAPTTTIPASGWSISKAKGLGQRSGPAYLQPYVLTVCNAVSESSPVTVTDDYPGTLLTASPSPSTDSGSVATWIVSPADCVPSSGGSESVTLGARCAGYAAVSSLAVGVVVTSWLGVSMRAMEPSER